MFRWTARFLLLVMVVPAFGPVAMASIARPEVMAEAMHCARQPVGARATQSEMPCHHAMAESKPSSGAASPIESSEASLRAVDNCCENHSCCKCATNAGWAQPVSAVLSFWRVLVEPSRSVQSALLQSSDISGQDSARAPPLS